MIPIPPKGLFELKNPPVGTATSPIVKINEHEKAGEWLKEAREAIDFEMGSQSFRFTAPEAHRRAYWLSMDYFVKGFEEYPRIEDHPPINIWDANREISTKHPYISCVGFGDACIALFEC